MLFFLSFLFSLCAGTSEISYFKSQIDYWNKEESESKEIARPEKSEAPKKEQRQIIEPLKEKPRKPKFKWKKYLNPKNDEFFEENGKKPPAPFMETARRPTDQNIRNWFKYIEMKNNLSKRMAFAIQQYTMKNTKIKGLENTIPIEPVNKISADYKRFRLRMYFSTTCPYCEKMFTTLKELRERGFYVEAIQVDKGVMRQPGDIPIYRAEEKDLQKYRIERVPFTVVADLKKNKLLGPIRGFQETNDILRFLQRANSVN